MADWQETLNDIARLEAEKDALRAALTLAANRLDLLCVSAIAEGKHDLSVKLTDWTEEARTALERKP